MKVFARSAALTLLLVALPAAALAQATVGLVLDQTGLPLPGATVQLFDGSQLVSHALTDGNGRFAFQQTLPGDTIAVSLNGFQTVHVPRQDASRVVLSLERASDSTDVVASMAPASPLTPLVGTTLPADTVARMPSSHMRAKESLPLLPSVVRGPDGLIQLGGARAYETPLLLDGFDIGDPATGISSLNLPFEAVQGIDVLRDPMAVTYGRLLGGLVTLDSKPGGDHFAAGVQGFVPRPRFSSPGFGRLEGIFPRAFAAGSAAHDRVHYMIATEYDYERIPVPGVTQGQGPDIVEESSIVFMRLDALAGERHHLTFESLLFPSDTRSMGLSPRREQDATADLNQSDAFAGLTDRIVGQRSVVTFQLGALQHHAILQPNGTGVSTLSPAGWQGSWFSAVNRTSGRYSAAATWERVAQYGGTHDFTASGEVASRRLHGHVAESPIVVSDAAGQVVRTVDFGPASSVRADDWPVALALRDVWQPQVRVQVDAGLRLDHSRYGGAAPSGRAGVRYALDRSGDAVVRVGYGSFVGSLPLAVPAFEGRPTRIDREFDPTTGDLVSESIYQPAVRALRSPRAVAATLSVERRFAPGLDAQIALSHRHSTSLATLDVPPGSGALTAVSNGSESYRDIQLSIRRTWAHDQQIFVSYVRSSARGELNDFVTLFQALDAPLVQPGGPARLPSDAPNRVLAWGTFNLPKRIVLSPVAEWHSGFPYSVVDVRDFYAGSPNSDRFPAFFSTDLVVYKTFTVHDRSADLGVQVFNVTDHWNPRDVYPVAGAPQFGEFTNSVGPIIRGYMLLKW